MPKLPRLLAGALAALLLAAPAASAATLRFEPGILGSQPTNASGPDASILIRTLTVTPCCSPSDAPPLAALLPLSIDFDDQTGIVRRFDFVLTLLREIGFGFSGSGGIATLDAARDTLSFDLSAPLSGPPAEPQGILVNETIDGVAVFFDAELTKPITSGFARLSVEAELDGALTPRGALPGVSGSSLRLEAFDQDGAEIVAFELQSVGGTLAPSPIPLPPAAGLLASALAGLGLWGRRGGAQRLSRVRRAPSVVISPS